MEMKKPLNFFKKEDEFYKNKINKDKIMLISIALFFIIFNISKFHKLQSLKEYVSQEKATLNCVEENEKFSNIKQTTAKVSRILKFMNNSELKNVEIKNKKLRVEGQTTEFEKVKNYLDMIKKIENTDKIKVDFINNNENIYEFEISGFLGEISANE